MKFAILTAALVWPVAAMAQVQPLCIPPALAQSIVDYLAQSRSIAAMIGDVAQAQQTAATDAKTKAAADAKLVADAKAAQKAEDDAAAKKAP